MSKKIGWFGMLHPCDEECPSGISRLAARTSPQIPAGGAQGGKAGGTFKQSWKKQGSTGEKQRHRPSQTWKKLNNWYRSNLGQMANINQHPAEEEEGNLGRGNCGQTCKKLNKCQFQSSEWTFAQIGSKPAKDAQLGLLYLWLCDCIVT